MKAGSVKVCDAVAFFDNNSAAPPEAVESEYLLPDLTGETVKDSASTVTTVGVAVGVVAVGAIAVGAIAVGVVAAVVTVTVFATAALLVDTARAAPATSTSRPSQDSIGVMASGSCAGLAGGAVPKIPGTEVSAALVGATVAPYAVTAGLGVAAETTAGIVGRTASSDVALASAAGIVVRKSGAVNDGVRPNASAAAVLAGLRRGPADRGRSSTLRVPAAPADADVPEIEG